MRPLLVLFFIVSGLSVANSQNLIQNPGFESGTIPNGPDQVALATGWNRNCGRYWYNVDPTGPGIPGSPDLFDTRSPNCLYKIPTTKWGIRNVRAGGNRYVGFSGTSDKDGPQWFGETVEGTLTEPLLGITYHVSFWAAAVDRVNNNPSCAAPFLQQPPSPDNRVEVVLRKVNDCTSGKPVYVSAPITSTNWQQYGGQFALSVADAAVGYDRIEFRLVPYPYVPPQTPYQHTVVLDDTELTAEMPTLPCCTCLGQVLALDLSTGQGGGAIDPYWKINGHPTYITPPDSPWLTLPPAQWLQPVAAPLPSQNIPNGAQYGYVLKFIVPSCTIPSELHLEGKLAGDNSVTLISGGGTVSCPGPTCYQAPQGPLPFSFNFPSAPGVKALIVAVTNKEGPSGMIMNAQLKAQCKKE